MNKVFFSSILLFSLLFNIPTLFTNYKNYITKESIDLRLSQLPQEALIDSVEYLDEYDKNIVLKFGKSLIGATSYVDVVNNYWNNREDFSNGHHAFIKGMLPIIQDMYLHNMEYKDNAYNISVSYFINYFYYAISA